MRIAISTAPRQKSMSRIRFALIFMPRRKNGATADRFQRRTGSNAVAALCGDIVGGRLHGRSHSWHRLAAHRDLIAKPRLPSCVSTGLDQPGGLVALEQVEEQSQAAPLLVREPLIAFERGFRLRPRPRQKAAVDVEPGETEPGRAGLPGAEHVALAAQLQILLGDAETVFGLAQDLEPRARRFAQRPLVEEETSRAARSATNAPPQLMQLCEPEAFGVLDDHDCRIRHVDADLDHRRRNQDRRCPALEALHRRVPLGSGHLAVGEANGFAEYGSERTSALFGRGDVERLALVDQWTNPVGARA